MNNITCGLISYGSSLIDREELNCSNVISISCYFFCFYSTKIKVQVFLNFLPQWISENLVTTCVVGKVHHYFRLKEFLSLISDTN